MRCSLTAECLPDWHLPSDEEWKTLEKFLGMSLSDADAWSWRDSGEVGLKLKSSLGWDENGNGDNSSGFHALPGGCRNSDGVYVNLGSMADFWSSSQTMTGSGIGRSLKNRKIMAVFPEEEEYGKHAVTHWEVIERFGYVTLVKCKLD